MNIKEAIYAYCETPSNGTIARKNCMAATASVRSQYLGNTCIHEITGDAVSRYREYRKLNGIKPSTTKTELSWCSAAIEFCRRELDMDIPNPIKGRCISRRDANEMEIEKRVITKDELCNVSAYMDEQAAKAVWFAFYTGLRPVELLGLNWEDVLDNTITIRRHFSKNGKEQDCKVGPKGLDILSSIPQLCAGKGRIFPFNKRYLQRQWKQACEQAGVEGAKLKDLRKSCGSNMLRNGARMEDVKAQLRHADIRTTQQWYAVDDVEGAAKFLE